MKKAALIAIIAVVALVGGIFAYTLTSSTGHMINVKAPATGAIVAESASADDIYSMFLCPCCGQALDKKNVCCGMADEMIKFIDSQLATGVSKDQVVIKTAEKYGINAVIEPKRELVRVALSQKNPEAFPSSKISFKQAVGEKAPDFTLSSIDGSSVKLSDYKGKIVVLFFNEGSMCYPACWDQMAALGNDERFNTEDIATFSILVDQKDEWDKIVKQVPKLSKAKILFDSSRSVSSAYDVLSLKSSMHPGNYPGHTYFAIDREGVIRYTFDDPSMAIRNDIVAAEIEKLR